MRRRTYNKPKMATVACSVLQLHIFLLPIPPIRPSYHFALPYIHSLLAYNLPSFLPPFPPFSSFLPSFLIEDLCFHMGKFLCLLWGDTEEGREISLPVPSSSSPASSVPYPTAEEVGG